MSPERHRFARRIFEEALQRPEAQRPAFLAAACQSDQEMAREVERLLETNRPAQSPPAEDTHPSLKIGRYVVTRELGRGGMGIVYEATDPEIGRHLAIKVINLQSFTTPEESVVLRDRLFREARSAGALSHPGIVVVYDVGQDNQMAYIAMELVDGPSLHQVLASGNRVDSAAALDILRQAAAALDYAHQCGIVHRDIKPANIMLHQKKQVKIADFGIARIAFEPKYTMTGTVMGTPEYMSPEQIEAQSIDGRSDQFSLAVVAYELLAGATPFHGGSFASVMHRIVAGARPSAHTANPALPAGVDEVLQRGMAQLVEQRYATCAEFVQALEDAMHGAPKAAVPVPPPPPPRRNRRWPYLLAGLVALVVLLGGAGYRLLRFPKSPAAPQPQTQTAPAVGTSQPPVSLTPAQPAKEIATGGRPTTSPPPVAGPSPAPANPAPAAAPPPAATPSVAKTTPAIPENGQSGRPPVVGAGSQPAAPPAPEPVYTPPPPSAVPPPPPNPVRDVRNAAPAGSPDARTRLPQLPAAPVRPAPNTPSTSPPVPPGAVPVRVFANAPWTDTGINLRAGDSVTVTASGLIAVEAGGRIPPKAPGGFAPDCSAAASIYGGRFGTFPAPRLPCWSLIGRVGGNGAVVEVGSKGSFRAGSNGRLLLGINDDSFAGNSGSWTAVVMVQRGR